MVYETEVALVGGGNMGVGLNLKHTRVHRAPAVICGMIFVPDGTAKRKFLYTMI